MPDFGADFYPPAAFMFAVTVAGITGTNEGSFQEVSGLKASIAFEEIKEGGENRFTHRFPKPPTFQNLILKRGMLTGSPLVKWATETFKLFTFTPKDVTVRLLDAEQNILASWNFVNAYPVNYQVADLKAQENSIALETLELAYDYFMPS